MKKKIILGLMIVLFIIWITYTFLNAGLETMQNIKLTSHDLSKMDNGFYHGQCTVGRWSNKVVLRVESGKIVEINFTKDQLLKSDKVRNEIINRVKNATTLPVDAVAGATVTSNGYIKSITDALEHGVRLPPKF